MNAIRCSPSSCLELTRMWRSTERASLEKKPSMRLSHEPCVGVKVKVKRPMGCAASQLDYNQRGTAEQWIKEGKGAIKWTRLSCCTFVANAVRLQLHALAYNLGNFMRTLAMPKTAQPWSLTSLREKLIKIGAKVVSHGRYVTFQMAEMAVSQQMFADILSLIARLRGTARPSMTSSEVRCGQITRGEVCLGASKAVRFSASVHQPPAS